MAALASSGDAPAREQAARDGGVLVIERRREAGTIITAALKAAS